MTDTPKKPRGFACLSPERRREISAKGGAAGKESPRKPWVLNPELAKIAGQKGGKISRRKSLTRVE